jgi:transposase
MVRRHELTDDQWERLAPLLPPQKPATGRPNRDHRTVLNGILWRLRTGVPWRDLPERYGNWQTVYSRFRRWQRAGVWARVLAALQAEGDAAGGLDWGLHFVDGTVVRAHQHAAGAKKGAATRPSAAPAAASAPSSTSGPRAGASRSPSC